MKQLLIMLLLIPALCRSQADSAKVTVSNVVIKAKDMYYIKFFLPDNNRNENLDSTINRIERTTSPGNNTDVTINSIERRVWREVYSTLYSQMPAWHGDVQKRVRAALILINDPWLNDKIPKDETEINTGYDNIVVVGKKMAKKEND